MSDCIFCKIVTKQIPAQIEYEDNDILAFRDINPVAPVHVLVIPKKHVASVNELTEHNNLMIGRMFNVIKELAVKLGVAESGYRVVTNIGADGGQVVPHLHFHLIGGKALGVKIG